MVTVNKIPEWVKDNEKDFVPPVCNKCMFSNQVKLFYVGGPNQRKDFHLEEGEELFFQLKGDMVLKVLENGVHKDVRIKEGEIFLLPSRVEHSPQRFENTLGFVVERTRMNTEFDCVRYFIGESTDRLFERWFHLTDVVKDLPPLIRGFHKSEEFATGEPGSASFIVNAPFEPRPTALNAPINLERFIENNINSINSQPLQLFGAPDYKTTVTIHGSGKYSAKSGEYELILWLKEGECSLEVGGESYKMTGNTMARVDINKSLEFTVSSGILITIQMNI